MFTGIIEEVGTVTSIESSGDAIVMTINAPYILEDAKLGDSIAVNGVCLTIKEMASSHFTVDLMPETVKATSLRQCGAGAKVNLERAMAADGRFGGHFVSGHVDGIGTIIKKEPKDNAVYYEIEVTEELSRYMIYKGSVTVDGTSLTIFGLREHTFTLSLIPHTLTHTILGEKIPGDIVNIETDMVGKYLEKFVTN
ncbi:riboflavin synthase alpha chain [Scopulibacillus darangshiensis]|uniref:Riboflavin synthase n=1 Tax=Scopulibacillus darangshiensis TaxID=442528 RepID=A0A4R2PBE4_9BACL|nr:riboflavin synthase [Scopulibacillus darangshiensis]TCP31718.1 riboflavin synthase alpha chain [Scopulibacillus darangshiensis]